MRHYRRNSDERTRALERALAAGDESAHAPLLAARLRAGDLPRVRLEVLAALDDPVAAQVLERPTSQRVLFHNKRNDTQFEWFNTLQRNRKTEAAFNDLILGAARMVNNLQGNESRGLDLLLGNLARNALAQGPTSVGRRMVAMAEQRLHSEFSVEGEPWDAYRHHMPSVARAFLHFLNSQVREFPRSADASAAGYAVLGAAWNDLRYRAGVPTRKITAWLRRATAVQLREMWGLPAIPPPPHFHQENPRDPVTAEIERVVLGLGCTPYEVNNGLCGEISEHVESAVPGAREFATSSYSVLPGHSWIYYGDRHYDAEAPHGVEEFLDLPIFQRWLAANPDVVLDDWTRATLSWFARRS